MATDHFPHISLSVTSSGSTSGVLRRHLMASVVHHGEGVWPGVTQPLYRLVQWVGDIWLLYNSFLDNLGLSSIATGKQG